VNTVKASAWVALVLGVWLFLAVEFWQAAT
jgi:hypothetical protein